MRLLNTPDGTTLNNINEFYQYASTHPEAARKIFTANDFYTMLMRDGFEYMEIYETLHKDANRARAMDNFFILAGFKGRTSFVLSGTSQSFRQRPDDNNMLYGRFAVIKSDDGYVDAPITTKHHAPWLSLVITKLVNEDFNEKYTAYVDFAIDPLRAHANFNTETILVGKDAFLVTYTRESSLSIELDRETYRYDDAGLIHVKNYTGSNMQIEVLNADNYIRFSAKRYAISGDTGSIPFKVRLSPLTVAQKFFTKVPIMHSKLELKATIPGQMFKQTLSVVVGDFS